MAEQLFRPVPCRLAALASLIGMGAEQVLTLARTIRLQSQWADPSPRRLLLLIIEPTVRRARDLHTKRGMGVGAAASGLGLSILSIQASSGLTFPVSRAMPSPNAGAAKEARLISISSPH